MSKLDKARKSLKQFFIKFTSVVDSGDNPGAEILLFKSAEDKKSKEGGVENMTLEEILKGLPEEDMKVIKVELDKIPDLEASNKDLSEEVDKLKKEVEIKKEIKPPAEDGAPSDEELLKSADPKIVEMLKKAQEEARVEKEKAEKLEKEKKEEQEKLRKEELKKEADKYGNIGATQEDLVEIFTAVDSNKEVMEKMQGILGAVNEALKDNKLMKSIGNSEDPVEKSAKDEVEEKAKALMEKNDKLTIEQARSQIFKSEPKLHQKYMEE